MHNINKYALVQKLFNVKNYHMNYFGHEIFAIYGNHVTITIL